MLNGQESDLEQEYMFYADISEIIFSNKQNIPWDDVERYLRNYIGQEFQIKMYGDVIHIGGDFPDEYAESNYTKKLRGALAKAKANASQVIGIMLENAENRRWVENKNPKHEKEASGGWYRYDVGFTIPVEHNGENSGRMDIWEQRLSELREIGCISMI